MVIGRLTPEEIVALRSLGSSLQSHFSHFGVCSNHVVKNLSKLRYRLFFPLVPTSCQLRFLSAFFLTGSEQPLKVSGLAVNIVIRTFRYKVT